MIFVEFLVIMLLESEEEIMKLKVNKDVCIGCGMCMGTCDKVFNIGDDGLAEVIVTEVPKEVEEDAIQAKDGCPVGAIEEDK